MQLVNRDNVNILRQDKNYVVGEIKEGNGLNKPQQLYGFFDGVNTLLDYIPEFMAEPKKEGSSSERGNKGGFYTFDDFESMLDTYRYHPSKVKSFDEIDLSLTDLDSAGQGTEFAVTGDYLDVGLYLEGDPECFGVMIDGNPRARRVNITVNLDWVCYTNEKILNARSRRIQRLVDWLEARGVRVAVTCISAAQCAHVELMIKDHSDTLDLNDLAVVTNGDYFRRICFRFMEYSKTWQPGYGHAFHFNKHLDKMSIKSEYAAEYDIIIGNNVNDVGDINREFDDAERKLTRTLGSEVLEPDQRVIRMFKGGGGSF